MALRVTGHRLRIVIIGSLPPPLGGCSVTLRCMVEHLRDHRDLHVEIIDTSGIRGSGLAALPKAVGVCWRVWKAAARGDVVTLHVATTGLPVWGFVVLLISRICKKPFIARKFAGLDYKALGFLRGGLANFVAKQAALYLVETKELLKLSEAIGVSKPRWLPTNRPIPADRFLLRMNREICRRFVYIGQVRKSKGIIELSLAAEKLPPGAMVDIYGPWFDDLDPKLLSGRRNIAYRGVLDPEEVIPVMQQYDAAVLPSKASTEGYPGMILEAYIAGLPVIATAIGAIPEIVDSDVGILVPPGNVDSLASAMNQLIEHDQAYQRLSNNAFERAMRFSSKMWADRFVEYCQKAVKYGSK